MLSHEKDCNGPALWQTNSAKLIETEGQEPLDYIPHLYYADPIDGRTVEVKTDIRMIGQQGHDCYFFPSRMAFLKSSVVTFRVLYVCRYN